MMTIILMPNCVLTMKTLASGVVVCLMRINCLPLHPCLRNPLALCNVSSMEFIQPDFKGIQLSLMGFERVHKKYVKMQQFVMMRAMTTPNLVHIQATSV